MELKVGDFDITIEPSVAGSKNPFNGIERVLVARLISYLEPCEGCLWSSELFRLRGMCIWGLRSAIKSLSSRKLILHGVRREIESL
jgi:hypothetical protein